MNIDLNDITLAHITALLAACAFAAAVTGAALAAGARRMAREAADAASELNESAARIEPLIKDEFGRNREESQKSSKESREETINSFRAFADVLTRNIAALSSAQKGQLEAFERQLSNLVRSFDEKTASLQERLGRAAQENRAEQAASLKSFSETFALNVKDLRDENAKKLEEMRKTVDEKLQETVERRFNESFKLISDRLEQVHKGLGEMQTLASGVGDLKKILGNVKTRGNLGEIQLGAILEEILSPEQYEHNAATKENSLERVEYAVKLPGKNESDKPVLLPIDSKFPTEDYGRLLEAYENVAALSPKDIEAVSKQFETAVKKNAKDIRDKYINPPATSDFAIMFVPTEGLYAEILRRAGLFETLRREYKITVVGPANLAAFLSSLQMGFRTLAIEKRSSEVWEILGTVKTQFGAFGDILDKTKKKLLEATDTIDKASAKSKTIERKLRAVQEFPQAKTDDPDEETPELT
jgi:DNA recombination protein RmuC